MDHHPTNTSHLTQVSSHDISRIPTTRSIRPNKPSHFSLVASHALLIPEVVEYPYNGSGTEEDPFVVEYIPYDPRDPMGFSMTKKWTVTILVAVATLSVAFVSSAFSGGIVQITRDFGVSEEVAILGISLYVLGFAIGPLFWAPLSELFGRQKLFFISFLGFTAFNAGAAGANNIATLIVLRFFAGAFGSSPLTNAGGVIADLFPPAQRGLALSIFAAAPFMGPVLGPIVGGFVGESVGFRWVQGVMAIFSGVLWILHSALVPETYSPVILAARAKALSVSTGKVYKSRIEISQGKVSIARSFKVALSRPWVLLFTEPIVLLLSLYLSIVYGVLYMMFAAYPIIFQEKRGWSQGIGGLAFIAIAIGMILAVLYSIQENGRFRKVEDRAIARGERGAPPEARLPPSLLGCICIPISLFIFAWTNSPSIHWIVCLIFSAPFGFGMVLIFLGIFNYLIDSYTIYAASVLAANSILRSTFGAVFPLFTTYMYKNLGIHWATSISAFLSLACVPFPFLFYKYGHIVRRKCKYSRESDDFMDKIKGKAPPPPVADTSTKNNDKASPNLSRATSKISSYESAEGSPARGAEKDEKDSAASAPPSSNKEVGEPDKLAKEAESPKVVGQPSEKDIERDIEKGEETRSNE